jgi:hypothetical protein
LNDVAWIPLDEELSSLEEEMFLTIAGSDVLSTSLLPGGFDENGSFGEREGQNGDGGKEVDIRTETLGLFCAEDTDSRDMDFSKSNSNGWITLALTETSPSDNSPTHLSPGHLPRSSLPAGKGYLIPFGRARSSIPSLEIGEIAFSRIADISCGSEHVVVLLENGEVWSLGNNPYGQRGIKRGEEVLGGWIKLEGMGRVKGVICGKWSSFFVVERGNEDVS